AVVGGFVPLRSLARTIARLDTVRDSLPGGRLSPEHLRSAQGRFSSRRPLGKLHARENYRLDPAVGLDLRRVAQERQGLRAGLRRERKDDDRGELRRRSNRSKHAKVSPGGLTRQAPLFINHELSFQQG